MTVSKGEPISDTIPTHSSFKGAFHMTVILVFAALVAASVAYSIYDGRKAEASSHMRDFYRVEYKKTYRTNNANALSTWY